MESEWKTGKMEGAEEREERQVVMNVLLFTAGCLQYGCACIHVGAVALGHL